MKKLTYVIIALVAVVIAVIADASMTVHAVETGKELTITLSETLTMKDSIEVFRP